MKKIILALSLLIISNNASSNQFETSGDILQIALPITALSLTVIEDDKKGRTQFYKSFSTTLGATYALKYSINRTRPNGADYSFPSGHTSVSFSSAAFIHKRYGFKKASLAYLTASFVGWTRIHANKHYPSDVLAGAALGTLSSFYFTTNKNTSISAFKDGKTTGLNFTVRW